MNKKKTNEKHNIFLNLVENQINILPFWEAEGMKEQKMLCFQLQISNVQRC